jgi:hypothetical protein
VAAEKEDRWVEGGSQPADDYTFFYGNQIANLGCYELKQHKLLFNEEYLKLLDQRNQAKLQCFQNPSQKWK